MRLLAQPGSTYGRAVVLTTEAGTAGAEGLAEEMRAHIPDVAVLALPIWDPSDHAQIFAAIRDRLSAWRGEVDVLLSAGTPQAQTVWVIVIQAGLLRARMLQVIPAFFVPDPHPEPVRVVRLDIDGFPEIRALRAEVARLRAQVAGADMIGLSPPMRALRQRLGRVAAADQVPVLLLGETGTGKELAARAIHRASPRRAGPFIAESCGAFAEGVLASELFGHEKGSFTGAHATRKGLLEQASGGTLFLDEVGELSERMQVLLLRVLQEGVLRRVGGNTAIKVDVRIVAATHRDLPAMIAAGRFREDLYYRLCGATLRIPPLRERGSDLDLLIAHFLDQLERPELAPAPEARARLVAWRWPGNVRELRAEVVRWTVFADGPVQPADLSPAIQGLPAAAVLPQPVLAPLRQSVEAAERAAITAALSAHRGNLSATARTLQIDRNTLKRKIASLSIPRD